MGTMNKMTIVRVCCSYTKCQREFQLSPSQRGRYRDGATMFYCQKECQWDAMRHDYPPVQCSHEDCEVMVQPSENQRLRLRAGGGVYCSNACQRAGTRAKLRKRSLAAIARIRQDDTVGLPDVRCSRPKQTDEAKYVCCAQTWVRDGIRIHLCHDHGMTYQQMEAFLQSIQYRDIPWLAKPERPRVVAPSEQRIPLQTKTHTEATMPEVMRAILKSVWEETMSVPYVDHTPQERAAKVGVAWRYAHVFGLMLALMLWASTGWAQQRQCTFAWDAPTQNADGQPAVPADIGGYRLYRTLTAGNYTGATLAASTAGDVTTAIAPCAAGEYYTVTALNAQGVESDRSNEVRVQARLAKPVGLRLVSTTSTTTTITVTP